MIDRELLNALFETLDDQHMQGVITTQEYMDVLRRLRKENYLTVSSLGGDFEEGVAHSVLAILRSLGSKPCEMVLKQVNKEFAHE